MIFGKSKGVQESLEVHKFTNYNAGFCTIFENSAFDQTTQGSNFFVKLQHDKTFYFTEALFIFFG